MPERCLEVHVLQASNLPPCKHSLLGGDAKLCLIIELNGKQVAKSGSVVAAPRIEWNWKTRVIVPRGVDQICIRVMRVGLMSNTYLSGCALDLQGFSPVVVEHGLYKDGDLTPGGGGQLQLSIAWVLQNSSTTAAATSGACPTSASAASTSGALGSSSHLGHTLVNRARTRSGDGEAWASGADLTGSSTLGNSLVNRAALAAATASLSASLTSPLRGHSMSATNSALQQGGEETASLAATLPSEGFAHLVRHGSHNQLSSTGGLVNKAETNTDANRQHNTTRVLDLLEDLDRFNGPLQSEEGNTYKTQVHQMVEAARTLPETGNEAMLQHCAAHVERLFDGALATGDDEQLLQSTLWLAGRLSSTERECEMELARSDVRGPSADTDLQGRLKQKWAAAKAQEAIAKASHLAPLACGDLARLEEFMDELDMLHFHAAQAGLDASQHSDTLVLSLKQPLSQWMRALLSDGRLSELEDALQSLGPSRVQLLGLEDVEQTAGRLKALSMIKSALLPAPGQVGFPELKERLRRMAVMNMRAVLAEAEHTGRAALEPLQRLLYEELLQPCMEHSAESLAAFWDSHAELHLSEAEFSQHLEQKMERLPNDRQLELFAEVPAYCKKRCRIIPTWMLDKLRETYRLPANWDVASMVQDAENNKLLAKTSVMDPKLLALFDTLLKGTAQPTVRTRDRHGAAPSSYSVVKAVEVMNARNWQGYLERRDQVAQECKARWAPHGDDYWEDHLNGTIMSMFISEVLQTYISEPLLPNANEMWLMHGTSHLAAEGITTNDFDLTKANPMGMFGAGIYFAESVSKADEYVKPQPGAVAGEELYAMLLCRVTLGMSPIATTAAQIRNCLLNAAFGKPGTVSWEIGKRPVERSGSSSSMTVCRLFQPTSSTTSANIDPITKRA